MATKNYLVLSIFKGGSGLTIYFVGLFTYGLSTICKVCFVRYGFFIKGTVALFVGSSLVSRCVL